jgi:hypothetical protein
MMSGPTNKRRERQGQQRHRGARKIPPNVTFPELETCYANRFNVAWRKAVEGVIEAGRILVEAKEALSGRFIGFVQSRLGMHPTTAQRLMAIAGDAWITDAAHVRHLPPSWGTLYLISRLAVVERERLLEIGCIRPDMQRADVEKAIRQLRGSGSTNRKKPAEPKVEPWVQPKPAVERMVAAMARNAEQEAEALAEIEAEARCSFCGAADADDVDLVCNASRTAFVCWGCTVRAQAILASLLEEIPGQQNLAKRALVCSACGTEAACDCGAPAHHVKRGRPKGSKKKKRVAPARQHGDEHGGTDEVRGNGSAR